jgi:hypothetical protein
MVMIREAHRQKSARDAPSAPFSPISPNISPNAGAGALARSRMQDGHIRMFQEFLDTHEID